MVDANLECPDCEESKIGAVRSALVANGGAMTPRDIAEATSLPPSTVSTALIVLKGRRSVAWSETLGAGPTLYAADMALVF
jgi:DNA-binding IclR family transcriptional regulator